MQPLSSATSPLLPTFELRLTAPLKLTAELEWKVDEIWRSEVQKRPHLTNGRIYSLQEYTPSLLVLQPIEYRHALALRRTPILREEGLGIRPLAVTGVLKCPDGVVLGRRSGSVAADNGMWEAAPSGGLGQSDPVAQVLEELREEIGLESQHTQGPVVPCGLVEDCESHAVDIVFLLRTALGSAEIERLHKELGSDEYAALAIIPPENLPAFLAAQGDAVLPALPAMLRLARVLEDRNAA